METIISRKEAIRFSFIAVSGILFLGANTAWNCLGYLNPIAWFLEWSSVILAFLCVCYAIRAEPIRNNMAGYLLIAVSLLVSAASFIAYLDTPFPQSNINASIPSYDFLVLAFPLALVPFLARLDLRNKGDEKLVPLLFFISVLGSLGFLLVMFSIVSPAFPTDESVFDMYAAHLFLIGHNPYDPTVLSAGFTFYNFQFRAFDPLTPLTTGGYVNSLTYPAMSFLVFIPAVLLKIKASILMIPALLAPPVIVWYRAWARKRWLVSAYALLPFIALLTYTYQGGSADTDALWASLLMLSYFVLPRHRTSGLLLGLSISVKQIPALAAPFYLYFVYREYGVRKMLEWMLAAILVFLAVNGYFILQNPGYWFSAMIANEFAPLIGIGFGIPQLSFTGIVSAPKIFFTMAMVDVLIFSLTAYVLKYRQLRYGLFIFPIIIFLFNYRLFSQYLFYWMLISILPKLDAMHSSGGKEQIEHAAGNRYAGKGRSITRIAVAILVAVILGSVALGYHEGIQKSPGAFAINSVQVSGYNATGYVDSLTVNISYQGSSVPPTVFFRLFTSGPVINGNMYQWLPVGNTSLAGGQYHSITIRPQYSQYSINSSSGFMVVAYYGNVQGSYYVSG